MRKKNWKIVRKRKVVLMLDVDPLEARSKWPIKGPNNVP
jgi:hypothetical protein